MYLMINRGNLHDFLSDHQQFANFFLFLRFFNDVKSTSAARVAELRATEQQQKLCIPVDFKNSVNVGSIFL